MSARARCPAWRGGRSRAAAQRDRLHLNRREPLAGHWGLTGHDDDSPAEHLTLDARSGSVWPPTRSSMASTYCADPDPRRRRRNPHPRIQHRGRTGHGRAGPCREGPRLRCCGDRGPVVMPTSFLDAQRTRRPGVLIAEPGAVSRERRARGRQSCRPQRRRPRDRCGGPRRRPARDRRRDRDWGAGSGCRHRRSPAPHAGTPR